MLYTIVRLCEHGQILDLAPPILYSYYIVAVVVKQYIKLNKRQTKILHLSEQFQILIETEVKSIDTPITCIHDRSQLAWLDTVDTPNTCIHDRSQLA